MKEAAVMLIIDEGLILSVSRRNKKTYGLAGGKCDKNETPIDCAKRECEEETGIKVKSCVPIFKRVEPARTPDGLPFHTHCFYAFEWEGKAHSREDGITVEWLFEQELVNGPDVKDGRGAFPDYNRQTLAAFKKLYPNIMIL